VISAVANDADVTLVLGVNDSAYDPKRHRIISNASCTTNCVMPLAKVLDDPFWIERGFMTTVHAYKPTQPVLDTPPKDLRRAAPRIPTIPKGVEAMPYELPSLPYTYDALEPHIDEETMRLHHDKHHQSYVDNLNKAIEGTEWDGRPLEQVLDNLDLIAEDKRTAVRNNGGGHANHSLFWEIMSPDGGGDPDGQLGAAIEDAFDGFAELKRQLNDAALKRFGSGWAWLVHDGTGLAVVSTPNQDSPLMRGHTPILGIDVWEHAYYLRYQNRRADYLEAWWNVVNWTHVAEQFAGAGGRQAATV
jgi:Fe-Mn family superoxide dismutase